MKRMILLAIMLLSVAAFSAEITILGNGLVISAGDLTPRIEDGTVLPDAIQLGPPTSSTFVIRNDAGGLPLAVLGIGVTDMVNFQVSTSAPLPKVLTNGQSMTFTITFTPVSPVGNVTHYAASITLNTDWNEFLYAFAIQGTGINASGILVNVVDDANANGIWDLNEVGIKSVETWIKGKSVNGTDGQKLTGVRGTSYQELYWQKYDVAIQEITLPAGYKLTNGGAKRTVMAPTCDGEAQVVFLASDKTPVGSTASEANNWGLIPDSYGLSQNYPNPFNPTTAINYMLKEDIHVTLQVFDVTGRVVATLVDGLQNAGHHVADFKASDLPSGNYFYKIQAGDFSATKAMVLMK